jgi:hypothetical protein
MNHSTHRGKARKTLSRALDSQLKLYVLSAGAAGASLMAFVQPAAAEVVYTQVHRVIPISPDFQYIDINGDGVPDVAFLHYTYGLSYSQNSVIRIDAHKNAVVGINTRYAEPLVEGSVIGASADFKGGVRSMAHNLVLDAARKSYKLGPWNDVQNRYLGVSFKIGSETHYGWIRMSVSDPIFPFNVLITGYAYESMPNQSLRAGQTSGDSDAQPLAKSVQPAIPTPASLGMLATGFHGLQLWRREGQDKEIKNDAE